MNRSQHGFTIIELVIVIAILGILGAVALPKFADLTSDAKSAAFDGIKGGFTSSLMIAHSKWLAEGSNNTANNTIALEGADVFMTTLGWPNVTDASQNTTEKLWQVLMSGQQPADWNSNIDSATAVVFTMTSANKSFTYNPCNGQVTGTF